MFCPCCPGLSHCCFSQISLVKLFNVILLHFIFTRVYNWPPNISDASFITGVRSHLILSWVRTTRGEEWPCDLPLLIIWTPRIRIQCDIISWQQSTTLLRTTVCESFPWFSNYLFYCNLGLAAGLSKTLYSPYIIIRMWQRLFILFSIHCLDFLIWWLVPKDYLTLMSRNVITLVPGPCVLFASGSVELGFRPFGCCYEILQQWPETLTRQADEGEEETADSLNSSTCNRLNQSLVFRPVFNFPSAECVWKQLRREMTHLSEGLRVFNSKYRYSSLN